MTILDSFTSCLSELYWKALCPVGDHEYTPETGPKILNMCEEKT